MEAYDWSGEVPDSLGEVPFDVILGTDVAYYEHLYAPFVQASAAIVRTTQGRFLLTPSSTTKKCWVSLGILNNIHSRNVRIIRSTHSHAHAFIE